MIPNLNLFLKNPHSTNNGMNKKNSASFLALIGRFN